MSLGKSGIRPNSTAAIREGNPGYVVYGAGGHGKVIADIILSRGDTLLGFVDQHVSIGTAILKEEPGIFYSVLGGEEWLFSQSIEIDGIAVAIGNNKTRQSIMLRLFEKNIPMPVLLHPSATISKFCKIGQGTVIMSGAVINPCASIGDGAIVNTSAVIEHDCQVGSFAHVSPNATMAGAASLGALSHLGAGAVILPGINVGSQCIVGAGAVVHRDVPDKTVVVGVPARKIRSNE
jgi:sugar O-acyltransferase (sialic acid O-acetyltransferase NeuD family)